MTAVVEIRTYKLRPGSGAAFHRTVVEESLPMLQRWESTLSRSAHRWTTTTPTT